MARELADALDVEAERQGTRRLVAECRDRNRMQLASAARERVAQHHSQPGNASDAARGSRIAITSDDRSLLLKASATGEPNA